MIILSIEASALVASVALVNEEKTLAEFTTNERRNHSVTLMPMIEYLFNSVETELNDVSYIAVTTGPGSFTGLRIASATAAALAHGSGKRILPVPTLDALAYNIYDEVKTIVPIMDARRNQVYTCFYKRKGTTLERKKEYMAIGIDECLEIAAETEGSVVFIGDGVPVYREKILKNDRFSIAAQNNNMQRAASVAVAGFNMLDKSVGYNELEILYLRKPQAEREYENKYGKN